MQERVGSRLRAVMPVINTRELELARRDHSPLCSAGEEGFAAEAVVRPFYFIARKSTEI